MKTANVLAKMQELTEKHVKLYKTDFYDYDRPRIERKQPQEFVWMIRDTGTHLLFARELENESMTPEKWRTCYDLFTAANERLYYCTLNADGSGTITRSPKKCAEFAARQTR